MFARLHLSDGNSSPPALHRLDLATPDKDKGPPVDPHSLDVLNDGEQFYANAPAPGQRLRHVYTCPKCFWTIDLPR